MGADDAVGVRLGDEETSRRGLLILGAGSVAAIAALASGREAKAGHDGTNLLHLAETNFDPDTGVGGTAAQGTKLQADTDDVALWVENNNGGSNAGGIVGVSGTGSVAGIRGVQFQAGAAVEGDASSGASNGTGVRGHTGSGIGVEGQAEDGVAGNFFAGSNGKALQCGGVVDIGGNNGSREILMVTQEAENEGAIQGTALAGGLGIEGAGFPAPDAEPEGDNLGWGMRGVAMSAEGGYGEGPGVGVHGESGTGVGVLGTIRGAGVAIQAAAWAEDGVSLEPRALRVDGRASFFTSGSGSIAAGQNTTMVADQAVNEQSHVTVTLTSDPGNRSLHWVELNPGSGFTIHMTSSSPKQRPETQFTYLITEW